MSSVVSRHLRFVGAQVIRGYASSTVLHDFHLRNGAKMAPFAGFQMPIVYSDASITDSHLHTRNEASLFDVSHMLQTEISGERCAEYMETMVTADILGMRDNASSLTVFTNDNGGILDDLIVTKMTCDSMFVVSNAAMREQDQAIMRDALVAFERRYPRTQIRVRHFDVKERSLLALQGPSAVMTLQQHVVLPFDLSQLYFMHSAVGTVCGVKGSRVMRAGYTGEDGFEISLPSIKAVDVAEELLQCSSGGRVKLAGLGARDSLRLEAGLCLYGNDLDANTTPIEASMSWLIHQARRVPERATFPGAKVILEQLRKPKHGVTKRRVGFVMDDKAPPARSGAVIFDECSKEIGHVTSGCPSPSLRRSIGMGYVTPDKFKVGNNVQISVRGKSYGALITKMPFVPTNYYTDKK